MRLRNAGFNMDKVSVFANTQLVATSAGTGKAIAWEIKLMKAAGAVTGGAVGGQFISRSWCFSNSCAVL